MSMELTLIPVAIVAKYVMDSQLYQSWMQSAKVIIESQYYCDKELFRDIKKCGCEVEIFPGVAKICMENYDKCFYVENKDGNWIFHFSKYDDKEKVVNFLKKLSEISNGKLDVDFSVFKPIEKAEVSNRQLVKNRYKMPELVNINKNCYPTIYRDKVLLIEALKEKGIEYSVNKEDIIVLLQDNKITFSKTQEQNYVMYVIGTATPETIFRGLQEIDIYYKQNVQRKTYETVMENIKRNNMSIVKQEVLEDETILLTLNL